MPTLNVQVSSLLLLYKPKVAKIHLTNIFIKAALNLLKFSFWFSAFALEQEKIYSWNDQAHNKYIQICYMQLLLPQKWSLPTEQDCYPLDKTLEEET